MTDWVHCNTCFRQPGSGPKFSLTNCGHIYCSDCLEASTKEKCRMCGNPCTSITLSAKMKPDVEIYFTDPAEILKKHEKQLIMVLDFQKNHRQRLTRHRRDVQSKHVSILESAKEKMKEMDCEINRLKEENRKLRSLVSGSPGPTSLKCSQRQLTPGRMMRGSPASSSSSINRMVHQTPSPSKNRGSPFSRPSYPTTPIPMDVSKGTMQSPQVVTPGPARYFIRTPPSGGRMGTIATPTSCANMMPSSSKMTAPSTPGLSPINNSPTAYHQRSGYSTTDRRNTPGAGGDALGRKQIQLNYTPHRRPPVLGMSVSASQP